MQCKLYDPYAMILILCNRSCVLNKTKDVNIIPFKTITGFNKDICNSRVPKLSYKTAMHYGVTNGVSNSKILFFKIFRVSNSMSKKLKCSFRGNS